MVIFVVQAVLWSVGKCSQDEVGPSKTQVQSQRKLVYSGVALCDSFWYLGIQFGHVSPTEAYSANMQKMLRRAHILAKLSLGMKEKVYFLRTWVLPCVFLAARACYLDSRVIAELRKVYQVALSIFSWGLTLGCLARPKSEGGYALAPPRVLLHSVHSGSLHEPHRFDDQVLSGFRKWAASVGLVLDVRYLRFLQLAPVRHSSMGILA